MCARMGVPLQWCHLFRSYYSSRMRKKTLPLKNKTQKRIGSYITYSSPNICVRWVFCPLAPWLFRLNQGFRQAPPPQSLQWYHWGTQHLKAPTRFPPIEIHIWRKTEKPTIMSTLHTYLWPKTKHIFEVEDYSICQPVARLKGIHRNPPSNGWGM